MSDSEELAVELHGLYRAGKVNLPIIANQFVAANGKVNNTNKNAPAAFKQIGGQTSQIYETWVDVRDKLQTHLGNSGKHVHNIAEAVIETMNDYKETDQCAADELDKLIKENEDNADEYPIVLPKDVPAYTEPTFPTAE